MSSTPPTKAAAMVQQRRNDSKVKRQAVLAAIDAMTRTGTPITVAEVARRARVSPWLVRQEPLITEIRKAQASVAEQTTSYGTAKHSTVSVQVERDLLRQENQRLRHEIRRNQHRISELLGDQIDGTDAHSQAMRVQELTTQNTALSQQASEALQNVHQMKQKVTSLTDDLHAAHTVNRALMAQLNRPGSR